MKKTIFLRLMTVAMMAAMCVTFTACGGDDGDSTPGKPEEPGAGGTTAYVEPCLDFGSSVEHVKEYMTGTAFQLIDGNNIALMYANSDATVAISYTFTSGLRIAQVTYNGYSESQANAFKAEIEKRYGVTMTKEVNPDDVSQWVYRGTTTINSMKVAIMMMAYKGVISIMYGLPD